LYIKILHKVVLRKSTYLEMQNSICEIYFLLRQTLYNKYTDFTKFVLKCAYLRDSSVLILDMLNLCISEKIHLLVRHIYMNMNIDAICYFLIIEIFLTKFV
jgi:hypothetical protein